MGLATGEVGPCRQIAVDLWFVPYADQDKRRAANAAYARRRRARDPKFREKERQRTKARLAKIRKEEPDRARGYWLKRRYGITLEQYNTVLEYQGGGCAVCHTGPTKTMMVDMRGTEILGLICESCSRLVAQYRGNPEKFKRLVEYGG